MTHDQLISTTGIIARIHHLPGRPPFILGADLAVAYGTETKRIGEAVARNASRFPEDFAFRLTQMEADELRSQNAATSMDRSLPLAFTHAGALALSGVLKTPIAAEVSVIVHRGFAAMERRALSQMRATMAKLRHDVLAKKPIYRRVITAASEGWSIDEAWRMFNDPRHKLEQAVRECVGMGLIAEPLAGMQRDLFEGAES